MEVAAAAGQFRQVPLVHGASPGFDHAAQQGGSVLRGQQVDWRCPAADEERQFAQCIPAGDHGDSPRAGTEHGGDLVVVGGVVQEDQEPAGEGAAAPECRALIGVAGDEGRVDAETGEQVPQGLVRVNRTFRIVPA